MVPLFCGNKPVFLQETGLLRLRRKCTLLFFGRRSWIESMKEPHIPVALEGYPFIVFAAFVTMIFAVLGYDAIAFSALLLTGFVLYFFRDPSRIVPAAEDALVSPADGKVILVEKIFDDRFVNEQVYKVSIFMNVFNVHVNRTPYPGTVQAIKYSPGRFYSANTEQGALENEYCAMTMATETGLRFAVVQVAGLIARRIVCWAVPGDVLARGQRFGLIRFGSRVDLYLPVKTQLEIAVGQKVKAGETVLGYLS
jgi:phosphatidylserine decarboxylase